MPSIEKPKIIIVAVVTAALLFIVDAGFRSGKSDSQRSFEEWLSQTSPLLDNPQNSPAGPPLVVARIDAIRDGQTIKWEMSSSNDNNERNSQLARLLDLMRESQVFARRWTFTNPGDFEVSVADAKRSFKSTITNKDIESSLPARNLLKLFEVYSTTPPAQPAQPSEAAVNQPVEQNTQGPPAAAATP